MAKITSKIGFIGAGVMAQAIAKAMLNSGVINPALLYVSAPSDNNFGWWKEAGINTTNDNNVIVRECEVVILAMKPQYLEKALLSIDKINNSNILYISVLAGYSTSQLKKVIARYISTDLCEESIILFRTIPNTALVVGSGCTAYCYSVPQRCDKLKDYIQLVETIFGTGGLCVQVPEDQMSAVGALSGSGVAYVYVMIEALCDGGVKMGIPRNLATKLAAQTFLGAAKMIQVTGKHPGLLKDDVCSAGGTTITAIHAMEKAGIRGGLIDAVEAAVKRSNELVKKDT